MFKHVEIVGSGGKLRGSIHTPGRFNPDRVIVFFHGYFSANRIGPARLFFDIAEKFAAIGWTAIRFDFTGMGESEGEIRKVRFSNHVDDAIRIFAFAHVLSKKRPVGMFGHCLGCNIGIKATLRKQFAPSISFFLNPFLSHPGMIGGFFKDEKARKQLITRGYSYRKGLFAHKSFFAARNIDFVESLGRCEGETRILLSEYDEYLDSKIILKELAQSGKQTTLIPGADHNCMVGRTALIRTIMRQIGT